jgi:hypothetical protein
MSRGSRTGESKAGDEWKVDDVASGADPDDWTFYPPQTIEQEPSKGNSTGSSLEAFFTQPRRRS